MQLERIGRRWEDCRCVVVAPGPSLTEEVAEACRGELAIAVNDAYRLMPWATVLYACDAAWWRLHEGCPGFAGEKWTSHSLAPKNDKRAIADCYGLHVVCGEMRPGFSREPERIHYGHNSGFQAVNLALLFGAGTIVLVGFDMRSIAGKQHFFGNHKAPLRSTGPFSTWIAQFALAAKSLPPGITILNATPGSALTCFPMVTLADALGERMPT